MRILLITHFFPPKHNAGTENYTLTLSQAFLAQGHDVHVLCAEDWQSGDEYWNGVTQDTFKGLNVHRVHLNWLKARNPNRVLYDSSPAEKWLDQFLDRNRFDIVHITSAHSLGVGVLRTVKHTGIPLVLTLMDFWFLCPSTQLLHSDGSLCDGKTTAWQCQSCLMAGSHLYQRMNKAAFPQSAQALMWKTLAHLPLLTKERGMRGMLLNMEERKWMMKEAITLPDLVLAHSVFLQQIFSQHTTVPIKVLSHGHELVWLNDYQGKTSSEKVRFGYIGQLQWSKGVHVLVEAFKRSKLDDEASLQVWGDPTRNTAYVQTLSNLIDGSTQIALRGRFEQDQLALVLSELDVVVVPSLWYENAPLVIREAFAANTPVIATHLGGMAEVVNHEVNGLLFERSNADDLASQLRRIVNEPNLIDQLKIGIPTVKTIEEEAAELEEIYRDLIKKEAQLAPGSFA